MEKRIIISLVLYLLAWIPPSVAQSNKPQVLVFGSDAATFAAAMQAALSGVQTVWISDGDKIAPSLTEAGFHTIRSNKRLDAGLWGRFLQEIVQADKRTDSILQRTKARINGQLATNAIHRLIDSTSNLTQIKGVHITELSQKGKNRWRVRLSNNQSFKVYAVIDGSKAQVLEKKLSEKDRIQQIDTVSIGISATNLYNDPTFRTALFCYDDNAIAKVVPYERLIKPAALNFFVINRIPAMNVHPESEIDNIPFRMLGGQAIGAAAAYAAFFKTSIDKINIRRLQGELLAYYGQLVPFQDIGHDDVHYGAIQRIGATGIFQGVVQKTQADTLFCFQPNQRINLEEIKPIIVSLFTRSQIWFNDKVIQEVSLKEFLDLIKFTALKGDEVNREVERGWTKKFNFTGQYDPNMFMDRRKAAVLLDYYLQPFSVNINKDGKFIH